MTEIIKGQVVGTVEAARWTKWEDEDTQRSVPILTFDVVVGERKLYPSLFFDSDLLTQGNDAGKSRACVSLEVMRSYEVDVDPSNLANNNPHTFGPSMIGKTVSLYCDEKDGKQRCFLNRAKRPELKEDEVAALWSELSGAPSAKPMTPTPLTAAPATKPAKDDDDLVF